MKVKDLIKMLEKMPKNLQIRIADHDHGKFETSSSVNQCEIIDKKEMNEYENDNYSTSGHFPFKDTPKKYVVIRP